MSEEQSPASEQAARWAGMLIQALAMSVLLVIAILQLLVSHGGGATFRYAGF